MIDVVRELYAAAVMSGKLQQQLKAKSSPARRTAVAGESNVCVARAEEEEPAR